MPRILHLFDSRADFQTQRCVQQLHRAAGSDFPADVCAIGPGGDCRNVLVGLRKMRREAGKYDLIHAWGEKALSVAALGTRRRIVYTPAEGIGRTSLRWLKAIADYRDVQVICPTATLQRTCIAGGAALDRCHLIRPGVDFSRINRRRNNDLRQELGLSENDFVLMAVGESTQAAHHTVAVWTTSILHVLDHRCKLLLWGRGDRTAEVMNFARRMHQPNMVFAAEQRLRRRVDFEELFPAVDMGIVTAKAAVPTLPLWTCMAAAMPIVAAVSATVAELLEDRHTALLAPQDSPRLLAQHILKLREDVAIQQSLSNMARAEAYEYASLTRFIDQHQAAYRQFISAQAVQVSPAAAEMRVHLSAD